jgi:hypothetical protein
MSRYPIDRDFGQFWLTFKLVPFDGTKSPINRSAKWEGQGPDLLRWEIPQREGKLDDHWRKIIEEMIFEA